MKVNNQDAIRFIEGVEKQIKIKQLEDFYEEDRILLPEAKELIAYLKEQNRKLAEELRLTMNIARENAKELDKRIVHVYHKRV